MIGTITATTTGVTSLRSPPPISIKSLFHDVLNTNPAIDRTVMRRRPNSLYEVLRVDRTATPTEIKTAYRSLAKVYHPDASDYKQHGNSNGGDRDFIEIYNAYETLKDPVSRASYDLRWNGGVIGLYTVVGRRQGDYRGRRWETDQCW